MLRLPSSKHGNQVQDSSASFRPSTIGHSDKRMTKPILPHASVLVVLVLWTQPTFLRAFPSPPSSVPPHSRVRPRCYAQTPRRQVLLASSLLGGFFSNNNKPGNAAVNPPSSSSRSNHGPTNQVVRVVNGMKQRRLGNSDILVSALGLGTQRWVSSDFNAPSEEECYRLMDRAILEHGGVNLIDTAEQYPIPSDASAGIQEGDSERLIGKWIRERNVARDKVVIATKITGGRNVTPRNIKADCECVCGHRRSI